MSDTAPAAPEAAAEAPATPAQDTSPAQETAAAAPEATPPAEAPKPKEPPLSPRAAALMKQEAALRKREEALKALEAKLTETQTAAEKRAALKKENALKWLEEEGLSYADLTEMALNGGEPPPAKKTAAELDALRQELATLKAERDNERKAQEEAKTAAQVADFWKDARAKVEAKADAFALTLEHPDGWDTVQHLINEHAAKTGEVLPIEEAAAKVEAALEAQQAAILKSDKVRAKLASVLGASAPAPKPASPPAASDAGPSRAARTLTNSQAAVVPVAPQRPLTRDERIAAATAALAARRK